MAQRSPITERTRCGVNREHTYPVVPYKDDATLGRCVGCDAEVGIAHLRYDPDGDILVTFLGGGGIVVSDVKKAMPGGQAFVNGRMVVIGRMTTIDRAPVE